MPVLAFYSMLLAFARQRHLVIYRYLGCLFAAIFVTSVPMDTLTGFPAVSYVLKYAVVISYYPSSLLILPLFMLYVTALTAEPTEAVPRLKIRHLLLPVFGFFLSLSILLLPAQDRYIMMEEVDGVLSPMALAVGIGLTLLEIMTYAQWAVYTLIIYRRLKLYRARLRDIFSSTDQREMQWVNWIMGLFAFYSVYSLIDGIFFTFLDIDVMYDLVDVIIGCVLITLLGLWGLRQRPGMAEADHANIPVAPDKPKYVKSALSTEDQQRIAKKLDRAMQSDRLFTDPDLSLWSLSKYIGVTPNYVSQTLNEYVHQSFFDYVNGWRIAEAKPLILADDQTVLAIAYDVGFNSRSSFYKAFKRVTGLTPSAFKAEAEVETVSESVRP